MKNRLFLILVLYVLNMQVAVAGVGGGGGSGGDADTNKVTKDVAEATAEAVVNTATNSWSPEDRDSPYFHTGVEDADGFAQGVKVETRTSSGTRMEEQTLLGKVCVSSKCNPSKKSEETSGENKQDSKKDKQASGANGPISSANEQALQQIINNANNMGNKLANDAATSVVVPPPIIPCVGIGCGPIVDPCIADPMLCGP